MSRRTPFAKAVFVPRYHVENLPAGSVVIDVSSYAPEPSWFRRLVLSCSARRNQSEHDKSSSALSPMWVHGGIPVPGMPGETSDTVEGVWQGLKVIRGKIATRYFRGPGAKRGGKPSGHKFGNKELGIVEARRRIYVPTYEWVLENRVDPELIEGLIAVALSGVTQYIHDVGDNGDINDANQPLAHAAVLVQYINRKCAERAASGR